MTGIPYAATYTEGIQASAYSTNPMHAAMTGQMNYSSVSPSGYGNVHFPTGFPQVGAQSSVRLSVPPRGIFPGGMQTPNVVWPTENYRPTSIPVQPCTYPQYLHPGYYPTWGQGGYPGMGATLEKKDPAIAAASSRQEQQGQDVYPYGSTPTPYPYPVS